MRRIFALLVAGSLALAACSKPPVSGVIEHKQHSARVVYYTNPCIAWGTVPRRVGNSTYYDHPCIAWGTHENVIPESWQFCIRGPDEDGKETTGCVDVPGVIFARYREGDHFDPGEATAR